MNIKKIKTGFAAFCLSVTTFGFVAPLNAESINTSETTTPNYTYIKADDLINLLTKDEINRTFGAKITNEVYNQDDYYVFYTYDMMVQLYGKEMADKLTSVGYDSANALTSDTSLSESNTKPINNNNKTTEDTSIDTEVASNNVNSTEEVTVTTSNENSSVSDYITNANNNGGINYVPESLKQSMMSAAGISSNDFAAVDTIVTRESNWSWNISNSNGSGAYGLGQALPGNKMASAGDDWATNPITQLKWMNSYAVSRYGSWSNALAFSDANGWW